jgi:hypothetical protein
MREKYTKRERLVKVKVILAEREREINLINYKNRERESDALREK